MYDTRKDTNMLFISFFNYNPDLEYIKPVGLNYILGNTIMPIKVDSDSMFSWFASIQNFISIGHKMSDIHFIFAAD